MRNWLKVWLYALGSFSDKKTKLGKALLDSLKITNALFITSVDNENAFFALRNIKDITIAAIAKGPDRNAGQEKFFTNDKKPFYLTNDDSLLYYLQRLRDEAHRFAIGSHRSKRSKAISKNPLDDINGIGAKRKKALLNHFGSARAVARAGLLDLEEVDGISTAVAHIVYNHFNTNA